MRFKSPKVDGVRVFAVSGINTISFAIDAAESAREGLLGFKVDRFDPTENDRHTMPGFKVFESLIPKPKPNESVSTADHPVQSLLWDDFTAKPGRLYEYTFTPLGGKPGGLQPLGGPVTIKVKTEPLYTGRDHDVFFNRGVASSQAYERKFGNLRPSRQPTPALKKAALEWLARDLDDAILAFIRRAGPKDTLLCCFYEFHYEPVVQALAEASQRVRELKIIIDAKDNARLDEHGKLVPAFPREANLKAIHAAGIPAACIILRDRNPANIQHNKFMVLLQGEAQTPAEVWTGSTNISESGFTGQTNVGHWVHDRAVAKAFKAYWDLLATNPGAAKNDSDAREKKAAYRSAVEKLGRVPQKLADIPKGTTPVFSPRPGLNVLKLYVDLADQADEFSGVTLAFGINKLFKEQFKDNTDQSHITFLLLEKKDAPNPRSKPGTFMAINAKNNVYKAWGSYIKDAVYQWVKETTTKAMRISTHVAYIHSKFLLRDPLGPDPIVITGSANFSEPSTTDNDENMIIIRGNRRAADIYFTEFNRLFNHYYFRCVVESTKKGPNETARFLAETPAWLDRYAPGKFQRKRLNVYTAMRGFTAAPS